jgi:hypothetical protein
LAVLHRLFLPDGRFKHYYPFFPVYIYCTNYISTLKKILQELPDQISRQYNSTEAGAAGILNAVVNYAGEKAPGSGVSLSKPLTDQEENTEIQETESSEQTTVTARQPATAP